MMTSLLMVALNILPDIRNEANEQTHFTVPATHKRFLETSAFPGAGDYLDAANREKDHEIKDDGWVAKLTATAREEEHNNNAGEDIGEFLDWAANWATGPSARLGTHSQATCEACNTEIEIGAKPLRSMRGHMTAYHTISGVRERKKAERSTQAMNQARKAEAGQSKASASHHDQQGSHRRHGAARATPRAGGAKTTLTGGEEDTDTTRHPPRTHGASTVTQTRGCAQTTRTARDTTHQPDPTHGTTNVNSERETLSRTTTLNQTYATPRDDEPAVLPHLEDGRRRQRPGQRRPTPDTHRRLHVLVPYMHVH